MVCFHGNKATRHKALSTCGPHLCSLLNYGLVLFLEESQKKLQLRSLNRGFQLLLSVYLVVGPPICNAALYGLHISPLRRACWDLLRRRR
uniref:Uncharacterized protein n=1 Tax=Knipowitschia caucasica TaxID=637954 RepID=A0AAV2JCF4_KNICA